MSEGANKSESQKVHHNKIVRYFVEGVVLAILLALLFILGGRALCKVALDQIASMTGTKITDESVDFNLDGSVVIKDLRVRPDRESEYEDDILYAETVYARFGLGSLLMLRPRLKQILVREFVLNAQEDVDSGEWNVSGFKLAGPGGEPRGMPEIRLEGGTFTYSKVEGGKIRVIARASVSAIFRADEEFEGGYLFDLKTADVTGGGERNLEGKWQSGVLSFEGGISSANIPVFGRTWNIQSISGELKYEPNSDYKMNLNIEDLATRQRMFGKEEVGQVQIDKRRAGLLGTLQWFFNRYRPWGVVDIELECRGNLKQLGSKFELSGTVFCKDVSINDRKFPYGIDNLTGRVEFTERSVVFDNLRGSHNQVEMSINGQVEGFGSERRSELRISSENMLLDDDLYTALKPEHKRAWDDFSPTPQSLVVVNYRASRDGEKVEKVLEIDLLGTEARYRRFPYPLENLRGRLILSGSDVEVLDVVSQVGSRRISLNGETRKLEDGRRKYDVLVDAENVRLDSVLLSALPEAQQRLYEHLGVSGFADAQIKIFTPIEGEKEASFTADVSFKEAHFGGEDFPFVITDVSGEALFTADSIQIKELRGRYGEGFVSLKGTAWPGDELKSWGYKLELGANGVELSEEFVDSFPEWLGMNIAKLQPEGRIDFSAEFEKGPDSEATYTINLDCLGNSINFEYFPYPLRDVRGRVELRRGSISFDNLVARPVGDIQIEAGSGVVEMNGKIELGEKTWEGMDFEVDASDILFDERFGNALPGGIQKFYRRFSPTGRFDLAGMRIGLGSDGEGGRVVDFEGDVTFKDCSAETFAPITDLNGRLWKIKGSYGTNTGFTSAQGILDVNSFRIKGAMLKDFHADVFYDESERKWDTKNITGDFYDGGLTGGFELKQTPGKGWVYILQTGFDNVELEQFLEDAAVYSRQIDVEAYEALSGISSEQQGGARRQYTKGQLGGTLCIEESLSERSSHVGRIRLSIRDMELGRLSPLSKLLLVLNLTEPKNFAFERMVVDSYIHGDTIDFEKFDLSGEAIAFTGSGKLDLKSREVNLRLTARGERLGGAEPGVLQSLTEGLGSGVVRMDVKGDVYNPEVTTTALPVLEATLGILGSQESDSNP